MKTRTLTLVCFLALFMISRTSWAVGGISIFLNMSNIAGDSIVSGHADDVTIQSFELGAAKSGTQQPSFSLTLVKPLSLNSPVFAADCASGITNQTATISLYNAAGTTTAFYSVALSNVVVTADSVSGNNGDSVMYEQISLSFKSITWTYVPKNPDGSPGTPVVTSYSSP